MARMGSSKAGRRVRRQFSEEFRVGAVRLVLDEGKTVGAVARELDLTPSSLAKWVQQARADRSQGKTGLTTEERAELAMLRKDNRELRMERDILKKAAVGSMPRAVAPSPRTRKPTGACACSCARPSTRVGSATGALAFTRI